MQWNAKLVENYKKKKKGILIKDDLATRKKNGYLSPQRLLMTWKESSKEFSPCFPSAPLSTAHSAHLISPESLLPTQTLHWQSGLSKPLVATSTELIDHITFKFRPVLIPRNDDIKNHNRHLTSWTHPTGEWRNSFSCHLSETMNLEHNSN